MTALQTSAGFAAYLWFVNQPENAGRPQSDAHAFARREWERFLPNANEGLGRLLNRIGRGRKARRQRSADRPVVVAA
ncbi:MAG: hypothetical protein U0871_18525 [Gemmataceae bacterium]